MIRNQFVYELNIDLDMEYITNMVMNKQKETVDGRAVHHRLVKDDPYMLSILKQYPLLSPVYNIYPLPAHIGIPLHIDTDRSCALNIPIKGTEDTHTIFYDGENINLEYDEKRIYDLVKSPVNEVFRHTLIRPLLINNTTPHEVTNNKNSKRITVSWSFQKGVTFEQAIRCFNEPIL
jgi:hypothetical protein